MFVCNDESGKHKMISCVQTTLDESWDKVGLTSVGPKYTICVLIAAYNLPNMIVANVYVKHREQTFGTILLTCLVACT